MDKLPNELLIQIAQNLDLKSLLNFGGTNRLHYDIMTTELMNRLSAKGVMNVTSDVYKLIMANHYANTSADVHGKTMDDIAQWHQRRKQSNLPKLTQEHILQQRRQLQQHHQQILQQRRERQLQELMQQQHWQQQQWQQQLRRQRQELQEIGLKRLPRQTPQQRQQKKLNIKN